MQAAATELDWDLCAPALSIQIAADDTTIIKDAWSDQQLPHSVRKLDYCDMFFALQKYQYTFTDFLEFIYGTSNFSKKQPYRKPTQD